MSKWLEALAAMERDDNSMHIAIQSSEAVHGLKMGAAL